MIWSRESERKRFKTLLDRTQRKCKKLEWEKHTHRQCRINLATNQTNRFNRMCKRSHRLGWAGRFSKNDVTDGNFAILLEFKELKSLVFVRILQAKFLKSTAFCIEMHPRSQLAYIWMNVELWNSIKSMKIGSVCGPFYWNHDRRDITILRILKKVKQLHRCQTINYAFMHRRSMHRWDTLRIAMHHPYPPFNTDTYIFFILVNFLFFSRSLSLVVR